MKQKIKDFGQYIGGAQKDLWKSRGLQEDDIDMMTEEDMKKYITRDSVWPLPDAKKMVENGMDPFVAYWIRMIRLCIFRVPRVRKTDNILNARKTYIRVATTIKTAAMAVQKESDMEAFYKEASQLFGYEQREFLMCADNIYNKKYFHNSMKRNVQATNFPYNTRRQSVRKRCFIPPQLKKIEREGPDYRMGKNINAEIWQRDFYFRGVQFGNWMTQKDRQFSMNYCYDALRDLAEILDIDDKDVAFSGDLALAFGARGMNRGAAHFETERRVINLTKMHGAGCTAHEWFHALDYFMAKHYGITDSQFASTSKERNKLPDIFTTLVDSMKYDAEGNSTDYYKGSAAFDKSFAKDSYGAWSSTTEMLARAFACYVKDVWGKKSDYLIAHADAYVFEYENQSICAIPQGEERELYDEMFDQLFFKLKKDGLLHQRQIIIELKNDEKDMNLKEHTSYKELQYDITGQYMFAI